MTCIYLKNGVGPIMADALMPVTLHAAACAWYEAAGVYERNIGKVALAGLNAGGIKV